MSNLTRRGFAESAAMMPLLLRAAATSAQTGAAAINPDPYSYVDLELGAALRKFPDNTQSVDAGNLAQWCASDTSSSMLNAPEFQPHKATVVRDVTF